MIFTTNLMAYKIKSDHKKYLETQCKTMQNIKGTTVKEVPKEKKEAHFNTLQLKAKQS